MAKEREDVILRGDDFEEGMEGLEGREGQAPEDEDFVRVGPENELKNEPEPENEPAPHALNPAFAFANALIAGQAPKQELPWKKDKNFLALLGGCVFIMLGLIFTLLYLSFSEGGIRPDIIARDQIPVQAGGNYDASYRYDLAQIDSMIQKANALYLRGETEGALKIYEEISVFSQSLSNYNLGVVQLRDGEVANAMESFKRAISNGENQTIAAINAAVCALRLNDEAKFRYYLDLAQVYLPNEGRSPLYNYYLALIYYYRGFYPEALQMLELTKVEPYADVARYLAAKIYAKLGLDGLAVERLASQGSFESSLSTGLLYARMGEYAKAKRALNIAMKIERDYNKSVAALNLLDLKTGDFKDMNARLNTNFANDPAKYASLDTYPIKATLNKDLFNINIAQNKFAKDFLRTKKDQADLLFYFATYQVFDARQAALYIKKSNIINYISQASDSYLSQSNTLSSVNVKLASVLNDALNKRLKQANTALAGLVKLYPEHSILHYNLGLSYAQMQNYEAALTHFSTAYHLNPKNYAAGAFALLSGKLLGEDMTKFYREVLENIAADENFDEVLYQNMLFFANDDFNSILPYLDQNRADGSVARGGALGLVFEAIANKANGLNARVDEKLALLKTLMNEDILANVLYFNSLNSSRPIKDYAQQAQLYFQDLKLDYRSLFGGPVVARDFYVALMQVSGLLNIERARLKRLLNVSDENTENILQTLAYMDIFAREFIEAYGLYNSLIDDYGADDPHTLMLASVAAIGANNPNSAIALLQLSKMNYAKNNESKAALGFLYHQAKNYEAALNQYKALPNGFHSAFFTFDLAR